MRTLTAGHASRAARAWARPGAARCAMKTYKTIPFEDVMSALPAKRRAAIEAKGRALLETIYRRATLAEMRKSRRISQAKLANVLGVKQMQVSRLERREDPRLSTLRRS